METGNIFSGPENGVYSWCTVINSSSLGKPGEVHKIFKGVYGCKTAKYVLADALKTHLDGLDPGVISENVLLFGIEGCGKTCLLKAASALTGSSLETPVKAGGVEEVARYPMSKATIEESIKNMRKVIEVVGESRPAGILIDDVHTFNYKDENGKVANFLTSVMEMARKAGVIIVAATSYPDLLDVKLLPWFEKRVYMSLPNAKDREAILRKAIGELDISTTELDDFDLKQIAAKTTGFTPADLVELIETCGPAIYKIFDQNSMSSWRKLVLGHPNEQLHKRFKKALRQWTPSHPMELARHKRFAIKYASHADEEVEEDEYDIVSLEGNVGFCCIY